MKNATETQQTIALALGVIAAEAASARLVLGGHKMTDQVARALSKALNPQAFLELAASGGEDLERTARKLGEAAVDVMFGSSVAGA